MNIVYRDFDNFSPLASDKKKSDTFGHVLAEDSSAKRLLRLLKKWAVWWWVVSFILQGSMVLERCSGMHILLMGRWNTVSKSDINPKSISSESIKFQKYIYLILFISNYINIYLTNGIAHFIYQPSFSFCKDSNNGSWFLFLNNWLVHYTKQVTTTFKIIYKISNLSTLNLFSRIKIEHCVTLLKERWI